MARIKIDTDAVYDLYAIAKECGITSNALKAAVSAGELPATKRGRITFVEGDALFRWLTGKPQAEEASTRG